MLGVVFLSFGKGCILFGSIWKLGDFLLVLLGNIFDGGIVIFLFFWLFGFVSKNYV